MSKSRLFALLTRDHVQLAERYAKEGDKAKAADLYAKAGEFLEGARLAAEIGDERRVIEYSLKGTLGHVPEGYDNASAEQVGELLATGGFHKEAVDLFELAHAYRRAAESSLKLQQPARAARFYERAKAFAEAALFYRRGGMLEDALRVLELEANRLRQDRRGGPANLESLQKVDLERAELLARLGRKGAGADLLQAAAEPTPKAARLLEEAGRIPEAIETYLKLGDSEQALRLVGKTPDIDRRLAAQVYLRCGRPLDAGHLFATLGLPKEAAQAYEAGADWARAGSRWEAAQDPARAAQAYLRADRPRDAARCFAVTGSPAHLRLAAAAYAKAGDHAAAAAQFLRADQPLDAANQLLAGGDRGQAVRVLTQVQPRDPAFREAMLLLMPLLVEERLFDDALHRLRRVPEETLAPGVATPAALDRLYWEARALEGLGRTGEALACYQKLATVKRDHRDAAARLAAIVAQAQKSVATRTPPTSPGGSLAESSTLAEIPPPVAAPAAGFAGLSVGSRLAGRYDILAELGRGGMGRVYKARDRELDELVAIKTVLHQGEGADEERLLREVQICRRITHPNVVRVFDLGRFPGGIFITMELIEGERLDRLTADGRSLPLGRVKSILGEIAAGLEEAHALGIVHRDLKPGNVILTPQRIKILDFGIARMAGLDVRLTQTGFAVGSPLYMSPEQLQGGTIDGRADLYSLGILAYTLIAGQEPFSGATATALALQHLQAAPPDIRRFRPDLPEPWSPFLARLLAKRPAERFQSAREVREAVAELPG
ncbi:MAG TPA: protein kinase [Thermoanaerobaculia bacterium]|nr:protein kinase [Thermoanaerobaculia bacterium]